MSRAVAGGNDIACQIGALASLFGVSVALGASGLALVVLAGAAAFLSPRLRSL